MHEDAVTLGDPVQRMSTDRGVPRGDREGEEALARLRNGKPELRDPIFRSGGMKPWNLSGEAEDGI
jgi:hypothetical protein